MHIMYNINKCQVYVGLGRVQELWLLYDKLGMVHNHYSKTSGCSYRNDFRFTYCHVPDDCIAIPCTEHGIN